MARADYKFFGIKLNSDKDADMICYLESIKNKQAFIKKLLEREMLKETARSQEVTELIKEWEERMSK